MAWPLSQDYNEAIQDPAVSFQDADLKQGEVVTNALGLPLPCSGNFADVYQVRGNGRTWAVKCFTRQIPGLRERYVQVSKFLRQVQLPFMVEFGFLEQGIRIRGQWYPILKMDWVEGLTLNAFLRDYLDRPQMLEVLAQLWVKLAQRLREADLAHCDLQHGNVLLVPDGKGRSLRIKLVDYDGMCVPALTLLKSIEVGHPAFQHPERLREGTYGLEVDRFSHLVIYTAFRSLTRLGRPLWEKYDNGDNLLFRQADLNAPGESALFQELVRADDKEVRRLTEVLQRAAGGPIGQVPLLEEVIAQGQTAITSRPAKAARAAEKAPDPEEEEESAFATVGSKDRPSASRARRRKVVTKKQPPYLWIALAVGAVLFLSGLAVGGILFASRKRPEPSDTTLADANKGEKKEATSEPPKPPPEVRPKPDPILKPKPDPIPKPKPDPEVKPLPDPGPMPDPGPNPPQPGAIVPGRGRRFDIKQGRVRAGALSPDGRHVLLVNESEIDLLEADSGRHLKAFKSPKGELPRQVEYLPDGRQALVRLSGHALILLDLETSRPSQTFAGHTAHVNCAAASADGQTVLAGAGEVFVSGDKTGVRGCAVRVWDVKTGQERSRFEGHSKPVYSVAISPDGRLAASASLHPTDFFLWEVTTGRLIKQLGPLRVRSLAFCRNGHELLVNAMDDTLKIWNLKENREAGKMPSTFTDAVTSLAATPDGRHFVTGSGTEVPSGQPGSTAYFTPRLWDATELASLFRFRGHTQPISYVAVSADGKRVLSLDREGFWVWERSASQPPTTPEKPPLTPEKPPTPVAGVTRVDLTVTPIRMALSADGRQVFFKSSEPGLYSMRLEPGEQLRLLPTKEALDAVAMTRDGRRGLCATAAGLRLWDLETDREIRRFGAAAGLASCLAISPDGRQAVSGSPMSYLHAQPVAPPANTDKTVRVWDLETGREVFGFRRHQTPVYQVGFCFGGRRVFSTSLEGDLQVWDPANGNVDFRIEISRQVTAVVVSPDSRKALIGDVEGGLMYFDLETRKKIGSFRGHTSTIHALAFSPDGKRMLSGSGRSPPNPKDRAAGDYSVRLWDVATGEQLQYFGGHSDVVIGVAFSADGRRGISAGRDKLIRFWDLETAPALPDKPEPR